MPVLDLERPDRSSMPVPVDRLNAVLDAVDEHRPTQGYLEAQNVNPVLRLRYNDHGPTHIETVVRRGLELYRLMKMADVTFRGATDHGLDEADEPVIIALGAIFHDVGHVVHRDRHPYYSVCIASSTVPAILESMYDQQTAAKLTGEVLHAIVCHHAGENPLTREAGIVRVADALDMERGRSREPYETGGRGINTISSRAIRAVNVIAGDDAPVEIQIEMTSAAGIYQVDELLKSKVEDSLLEEYIDIVAVRVDEGDRLIDRVEL